MAARAKLTSPSQWHLAFCCNVNQTMGNTIQYYVSAGRRHVIKAQPSFHDARKLALPIKCSTVLFHFCVRGWCTLNNTFHFIISAEMHVDFAVFKFIEGVYNCEFCLLLLFPTRPWRENCYLQVLCNTGALTGKTKSKDFSTTWFKRLLQSFFFSNSISQHNRNVESVPITSSSPRSSSPPSPIHAFLTGQIFTNPSLGSQFSLKGTSPPTKESL